MFPNASKVIGIDLSPYMLAIGGYLMKEISVPKNSMTENGLKNSDFEWVDVIEEDNRVEFRYDDIAHTDIESGISERALKFYLHVSISYVCLS
jgi:hypothetical protein